MNISNFENKFAAINQVDLINNLIMILSVKILVFASEIWLTFLEKFWKIQIK